ncbi:hypothetical protein [Oryzihumus leptocrescens]|uniref:Uncharacterized protein n=1 Tax=Oryzihumus leptocrescens TaxID=297536 RepID=A0A542ZLF0_9MICO|nr:hypothetical protein [Oryzihumus leptocrescens]TQL61174.1 hypothetical protein FB474_2579 [Oryzihumus leptocrescens]
MVVLIVGMLLCLGLAVAVVGVVAVPARRQGRDILTPRGEEVVAQVKEATGTAVEKATEVTQAAVEKTGEALSSAKDKVTDSTSSKTPE